MSLIIGLSHVVDHSGYYCHDPPKIEALLAITGERLTITVERHEAHHVLP